MIESAPSSDARSDLSLISEDRRMISIEIVDSGCDRGCILKRSRDVHSDNHACLIGR